MVNAQQETVQKFWMPIMVGGALALSTGLLFNHLWHQWTLFAGFFSLLYFSGLFRSFPWKTPLRKTVSIGIFLGLFASSVEWLVSIS